MAFDLLLLLESHVSDFQRQYLRFWTSLTCDVCVNKHTQINTQFDKFRIYIFEAQTSRIVL